MQGFELRVQGAGFKVLGRRGAVENPGKMVEAQQGVRATTCIYVRSSERKRESERDI